MPVAAGISAAGSLAAGGLGLFGSLTASSQQSNAAKQALAQQQALFGVSQNALQPYVSAGQSALPTLQALLTPGANQTTALSAMPGFQFAQNWGQTATQNLGTTTGLGGNTLTAGANFATGLAQQGYGQIVQQLQGLVNTGQGAAGSLGGLALGTGGQLGGTLQSLGSAQAAGTLGATNALGSGISGAAGGIGNALLLSKLFGGNSAINGSNSLTGIYSGAPTIQSYNQGAQIGGGP